MKPLIIDNFAGGGGASTGIEAALRRPIDIAVNHDGAALAMHCANHPRTRHLCADVFDVDPAEVCAGRPVDLAWFSPDCTHFSKAKGGKPREQKIRGLAWVVIRWAETVKPRVIMLENVEEFQHWGPLDADNKPCPKRRGLTFRRWRRALETAGYAVELRELVAAYYGAPTTRKRLFIIARSDGQPIVWPEPTHGPGLEPYRTAGDCIDWSIPCPSIFERKKPLALATQRRIARGMFKYVIDCERPFIVPVTHPGDARIHDLDEPIRSPEEPLSTICTGNHKFLVAPTLIQTGYGERPGQRARVPGLEKPLGTCVNGCKHALVAAFLAKHFGGHETPGSDLADAMGTVTARDHHALVTSHIVKLKGTSRDGQSCFFPLHTVQAGGCHYGEVRAFLTKFYGSNRSGQSLNEPAHTLTARDRLGLVTIHGEDYHICDIGMRMLGPRELFRAQGFEDAYIIDPIFRGKHLTKTQQVRLCGNSVCPQLAEALVRANLVEQAMRATA